MNNLNIKCEIYEKEEAFINAIMLEGYQVIDANRKRGMLQIKVSKDNVVMDFKVSDYVRLNEFVKSFKELFEMYVKLENKRG